MSYAVHPVLLETAMISKLVTPQQLYVACEKDAYEAVGD